MKRKWDWTQEVTQGLKKAYDRQEDLASITSHIHSWVLFLLWLHPFILLELFLHWSPVAYWAPTDLGSFSLSILSFCLFIRFMGFSRQEYWSGLPFPSPVDHILSDLSTMTRLTLNRSFIFRIMSRERVTLGISLTVMVSLSQRPLANLFSVSWVTCHL